MNMDMDLDFVSEEDSYRFTSEVIENLNIGEGEEMYKYLSEYFKL